MRLKLPFGLGAIIIKKWMIVLLAIVFVVAAGGAGVYWAVSNNTAPEYSDSDDYSEETQDGDNEEDSASDTEEENNESDETELFIEKLCATQWLALGSEVGDSSAIYTFSEDGNVTITFEYDMSDSESYDSTYTVDSDGVVSFSYSPYGSTISIDLYNLDSEKLIHSEGVSGGESFSGMFIEKSGVNISDNFLNEIDGSTYHSRYFEGDSMGDGIDFNSDSNGNYECTIPNGNTRLNGIGVTDEIARLVDYGEGNGYLIFIEKCTDNNDYVNAYIFDNGEFKAEKWARV